MSQEFNVTPVKRPKYTSRTQRNRPVLVTGDSVASEQSAVDTLPAESKPVSDAAAITSSAPKRRLPSFFPTIGKSASADKPEIDPAQARIARATRSTKANTQTTKAVSKESSKDSSPETSKSATKTTTTTKPNTPAKPASAFKTRHIIGIAIYLLAANFLGLFETAALRNIHADSLLTKFNFFGNPVSIYTSTLTFLATLVVILVLLAKFDFIPRSLGPSAQQRAAASKASTTNKNTESVKTLPPTIRPGVKGSDDKLYESYRLNQRREKKR
jgi:hypothetical protein